MSNLGSADGDKSVDTSCSSSLIHQQDLASDCLGKNLSRTTEQGLKKGDKGRQKSINYLENRGGTGPASFSGVVEIEKRFELFMELLMVNKLRISRCLVT
jgi:hypothetical protein